MLLLRAEPGKQPRSCRTRELAWGPRKCVAEKIGSPADQASREARTRPPKLGCRILHEKKPAFEEV